MVVRYSKFQTEDGYISPNLSIDELGNIRALSIDVRRITLAGDVLFDAGIDPGDGEPAPPQTSLSPTIINSSLQTLGTLSSLVVSGNTTISNGLVQITSSPTGSLNNFNIGAVTPGNGNFVGLTATNGTITTLGATTVTSNTVTSNTLTSNTVTINNAPTNNNHATTKSYVDTQITALSIALGM